MLNAELILNAAPDGILFVDVEGRIQFANLVAARLLGCAAADELYGQPIRTYMQFLVPPHDTDGLPSISLGGITLLPHGEQLCWRDDGASFPIEFETKPIAEDEHLAGAVITFRDVSQRRATDQLKAELISVVSHELRTPLTSMRSALGLLASGVLGQVPQKGQRMLEIAVTNTDRLIRLSTDLLDLESLNAGHMRLSMIACAAGELMAQAADSVRSLAERGGVLIEVVPNEATLPGDPDRLLQVMTNLLANAIKFSPATGGTVWIDAERSIGELIFRVRDEGRGIPPDKLETIFDRFAQLQDSDSREKGGTGLGLAICRAIVKEHHGHIWAESTLGAGTTLCVALPCDEVSDLALLVGAEAHA